MQNFDQTTNLNTSANIFRCSGLPNDIPAGTKVIFHSKFGNKRPYVRQFLVERFARVGNIPERLSENVNREAENPNV